MDDQYLRNPCCLFAGDSREFSRAGRDGTSPDQREFVLVQHRDWMVGAGEADSNERNGGVASALIAGRSGASVMSARYLLLGGIAVSIVCFLGRR